MFSNLMDKVFGGSKDESEETPAAAAEPVEGDSKSAESDDALAGDAVEGSPKSPEADYVAPEEPAVEPVSEVDVEAKLNDLAANASESLDWKVSIVDLLKLLELDSSYGARKEMALELGYSEGDIESKGSAEMNMWLHKQVLNKIAENGGKLPEDLLS